MLSTTYSYNVHQNGGKQIDTDVPQQEDIAECQDFDLGPNLEWGGLQQVICLVSTMPIKQTLENRLPMAGYSTESHRLGKNGSSNDNDSGEEDEEDDEEDDSTVTSCSVASSSETDTSDEDDKDDDSYDSSTSGSVVEEIEEERESLL